MSKIQTLAVAALLVSPCALLAQTFDKTDTPVSRQVAAVELPDSPSASLGHDLRLDARSEAVGISSSIDDSTLESTTVADDQPGNLKSNMAPRYATVILPGQTAVPLHGHEKAVYGLVDTVSPWLFLGETLSAGWSHLIQSAPHYGSDAGAFGQREGAAVARGSIQTLATDAIFAPMFHDDPRYYVMGNGHSFASRFTYAATRVVMTRSSHSMDERINAPLMLGYLTTAGANNLYYPSGDRTPSRTFSSFGYSLVGAALGFEVNEFMDDALKMVHLRKQ